MESVEELCDEIVLIDRSKLILYGEVDEIKRKFSKNHFEVTFAHPIDDKNRKLAKIILILLSIELIKIIMTKHYIYHI